MSDASEKLVELLCGGALEAEKMCIAQPDCEKCPNGRKGCQERTIADYLIANGVTVQEWISVKDRLPEKEGDYLIYATVPFNGRKFMAVMHYEKDAYLPIWSDTTHWMPLPQPPKGE